MIRNGLTVNASFAKSLNTVRSEKSNQENTTEDYDTEFPRWLRNGERRLLASPMAVVKANLVVAKDGTGHFKTVQAKLRTTTPI